MYYRYPECDNAYNFRNHYFFGNEIFVSLITSPNDKNSMLGSVNVWLHEGLWFDFFNGLCYKGNKTVKIHRNLEEYPVFAKSCAIIPTASSAENNTLGNKEDMTVDIGDGNALQNGEFVTIEFDLKWGENTVFTVKTASGNAAIIPCHRNWDIKLRGFAKEIEVKVTIDGKEISCNSIYDVKTNTMSVLLENVSANSEMTVEISGTNLITDNANASDRMYNIILRSQIDYATKQDCGMHLKIKSRFFI